MNSKFVLGAVIAIVVFALLYVFVLAPKPSPESQLPEQTQKDIQDLSDFTDINPGDENFDPSEYISDPSELYKPEFDGSKETIESCANAENEFKQQNCLYALALYNGDASLCENAGEARDDCLMQLGVKKNDASLCNGLDALFCEIGCMKEMCIGEVAISNNSPSYCDLAGYQKDDCYYGVATVHGNQALCQKAGQLVDLCNNFFVQDEFGEGI
ncbi:MAG: hypothetical protein V1494_04235 [Candidatus Diapherotrites archaeon]